MIQRVQWDKVALPNGFFVFRYDAEPTYGWRLIARYGGAVVATMAQFQASLALAAYDLPYTYPAAYIPATGAITYTLNDEWATRRVGTHYQICQFWNDGSLSPCATSAPTWTRPEDLNGNLVGDQLVYVEKLYVEEFKTEQLQFQSPATGELSEVTSLFGKSYSDIGGDPRYNKDVLLEIKGDGSVYFKGDLLLGDIGPNIAEPV